MKTTVVLKCIANDPQAPGSAGNLVTCITPYSIDRQPGLTTEQAAAQTADQRSSRYQRVNEGWSKATPSGRLTLEITNPDALAAFEADEYYLCTIERFVPEPPRGAQAGVAGAAEEPLG
jgi:hypothetical protein